MKEVIFVFFLILIFVSGCINYENDIQGNVQGSEFKAAKLDLQISTCQYAEKGGTCDSRLETLGFLTPEECCEISGMCCP